jgi:hypothetical protein
MELSPLYEHKFRLKSGSVHIFDPISPAPHKGLLAAAFKRAVLVLFVLVGVSVGRVEGQCVDATLTSTNVSCNGGNDGTITINIQDGTSTYEYSLDAGSTWVELASTGLVENLIANNYSVQIRDAVDNTCLSDILTATISQPVALSAGTINNTTSSFCLGMAIRIGGDTPYEPPSGVSSNTRIFWETDQGCDGGWTEIPGTTGLLSYDTPQHNSLGLFCYRRTIRDELCTVEASTGVKRIEIYPDLESQTIVPNPSEGTVCENMTVSASFTGGSGGFLGAYIDVYDYSVDGGSTWSTFTSGQEISTTGHTGTNSIQIRTRRHATGVDGCDWGEINTVSWDVVDVPSISISNTTDVLCFGNSTGQATAAATGGTGSYLYSWNTTPVQTTATATGLTAGTYTVTVTDQNGCTDTEQVTISQPAALVASIAAPTNVLCFGQANGSATASATGGTGSYLYSWNTTPVQTTATATGLTAGTYTVTVTDQNGCTDTEQVTISQPAALVASIAAPTNVLCFGQANGSATASATGGTGSYLYSWNTTPVQTTATATGLTAGTYTVTVTDQNGCTDTEQVTISQPAALVASIAAPTNVLCFGQANGSATASATGGTGSYLYSWNTTPVQTTATATGLTAGTYTVTVTDQNGCTDTEQVTISQPAALVASIAAPTNVLCFGQANGSATASATGGTGSYLYSWNTTPVQTTATATGLTAGTYTVTVTDQNGCTDTEQVTISQPAALVASIAAPTNVLCFGQANGSATASATGGTGSYLYSWNTTPVQTTATATGLTAGTYTVTVTDQNGCTDTEQVTISQPAALVASIAAPTNVLCFGQANGSATASATGGTGSYLYSWNTTPVQTTATATGLTAGTYTVTVTDQNGCTDTEQVTISQPAALVASIAAPTNVLCFGQANGSATASATGGTGSYLYSWNTTPVQTTATATGLTAGTYTVTVTDQNGCTDTEQVTISQPAALVASIAAPTNVLCFGQANGSATASATGGTGSYLYSWNTTPVQTTATATGLTAGTYTVTVTDQNGCTDTEQVTISQPAALVASIAAPTNVLCFGQANGSATASATGGTGSYLYSWNTTPVQTTATATGLTAGTYTVTVTDQNGCTDTEQVTISQPAALVASIAAPTNVLCFGQANGSATASATGGTGSYLYSWNTTPVQTTATATGLTAGTYTVTVTDQNGCTDTEQVTISQPAALVASIAAPTNVLCFGQANGSATASATGGTGSYLYSWNTTPVQTTATATGLTAGTYTVTVTDQNGCTDTEQVTISQPAALVASIAAPTNVLCFGQANGSATASATGGTGSYLYSWNTTPVQTTATATGLTAGTYTVTVTDQNGCTDTEQVTISQPAALVASIAAPTNVLCFGQANGSATASATGGTGSYLYSWNTTPVQTTATATGLTAGTYTVTVTDQNGCTDTEQVTISQPAALVASIAAPTNVLCFGQANGSATASATGGTGSYLYSWNTTPVQTTATATGLTAGTYTVTVTDQNGCTDTEQVTISQPAALVASIAAPTNVLCFGQANGSATASATGGTGSYLYSWNTTPVQTTATATGLTAGTYTVTVTDQNGCTDTEQVTISQPAALVASIAAPTNVLCFGQANGSATASATGGTGSYLYSWNTTPVQTTATATGLTAGTYTVTVTDQNGCTDTEQVTISQPAALVASIAAPTNVLCFGQANGSATASATGGTGSYLYSWNTTPVQTTATATGLTAGTYTVTVTDQNGCTDTEQVTISQPAALVASIAAPTNVLCFGQATGSATAIRLPAEPDLILYSWNTTPATD